MSHSSNLPKVVFVAGLIWASSSVATVGFAQSNGSTQVRQQELDQKFKPLLEEYCLACHAGAEPDAGLSLEHFDEPLDFLKGRVLWRRVAQKVKLGEMPPAEESRWTSEQRDFFASWIEQVIEEFECGLEPNPGRVTLRRLNESEYRNTIRDLFGLRSYTPKSAFAGDDVGYGFDNIGDVLTLPPSLMEKYFLEAERISEALIQVPPQTQPFEFSMVGGQLEVDAQVQDANRELLLASSGTGAFEVEISKAGPHYLTITADGDQAGDEPCLMGIELDGRMQKRIPVPNHRGDPQEFSATLRLRAGNHRIGIRFLNDFYRPASGSRPVQDRNLRIHHIKLTGRKPPVGRLAEDQMSSYHKKILFTYPANEQDLKRATADVLRRLASYAYRRAVAEEELRRLVLLASSVQDDGGSYEESIRVALQAILISPNFLFRVELPRGELAPGGFRELDDYELATRLSYFLWSSMPDDELLRLAGAERLREGNVLEQQIARMIKDPKSNEFVRNFAGQWLTLRKLEDFRPDPQLYPQWSEQTAKLVRNETMYFFAGVMRRNMSVLNLLDAEFTYLNQELAEFYGIRGVEGSQFRPVSLKGTTRGGLLTHASVLAVTSNPTRTSPVKRGKWILDNLLAQPPPMPPAGVPNLENERGEIVGSLRDRLEQHRADPACANCHKLMDPLGFALEQYNAVGLYRDPSAGKEIDATGELPDGSIVRGAQELQSLLLAKYKRDFVECVTEKMLTYALGRGLEYYDKCAVDKIVAALEADDYRFSTLVVGIVRSEPFLKKGERDDYE